MNQSRLGTIFFVVFIDLLGFSLILPLLPYYAEAFGASDFLTGLLVASYAAAQLVGAPVLGRLSDRYGRRPVLLASIAGTIVGFLLLGFADAIGKAVAGSDVILENGLVLAILFLSRIIDGLTGGNISVAQAYIADISNEQNRARSLGLVGAAFGLGFIIGPAAGGFLSQWGYEVPALAAAGLATLNWLGVLVFLPESLSDKARAANVERQAAQAAARAGQPRFSLDALKEALDRPYVGPLLHITFFFGLAFAMLQTMFSLYALNRFELEARSTGYILTYVGVLSVVVQGALIGPLTRRFSENTLILACIGVMAVSLLGWALAPNVPVLLVVLAPVAFSGGVLNTTLRSAVTKAVHRDEVGGILGVQTSIESATRVIAPSLGGLLIGTLGTAAPGIFGALLLGTLLSFTWRRLVRERRSAPTIPQPGDEAADPLTPGMR